MHITHMSLPNESTVEIERKAKNEKKQQKKNRGDDENKLHQCNLKSIAYNEY